MRLLFSLLIFLSFSCEAQWQAVVASQHTRSSTEDNSNNTNGDNQQIICIIGDSIFAGNSDVGTGLPDAIAGAVYECDAAGSTITAVTGKHIRGESTGSPWIQFANERFTTTGIKTILVNTAVGGATVYPSAETSGGTLNTWYPGGTNYNQAISRIDNALAAAGISEPRVLFVHCGINDEEVSTTLENVQLGVESLVDRLLAEYPGVEIVWSNFGWVPTNSLITRASNITTARARFIRKITIEQARDNTMVCMGPYLGSYAQNSYNQVSDVHLNDNGNIQLGNMLEKWLRNTLYSKEARAIISSHYDELSVPRKQAIENFITGYGLTDYYKTDGILRYVTTDKKNLWFDWGFKSGATNTTNDITFIANGGVSLNGTNQAISTGLVGQSSVGGMYATQDNAIFLQKIIDARDPGINTYGFGGALNTAGYVGVRQLSTGGFTWRINEGSAIHNYTGVSNFADNTVYGVIRTGSTTSGLIIGSTIVQTDNTASNSNAAAQIATGVLNTDETGFVDYMDGTFGWVIQGPADLNWTNIITVMNALDAAWIAN